MFLRVINVLRKSDHGQDLAEYCLITALIALIGLGIFYKLSGGVHDLWSTANSAIVVANTGTGDGVNGSTVDHH